MRILKRGIYWQKGTGFLQVVPTEEEDLWHLYNLIQRGDLIKTSTYRKIIHETNTGTKTAEKRRIVLLIKVTEVNYWVEQHLLLSVKGKNCKESPFLSLGQFHTIEFELNVPVTIYKENWDQFHSRLIKEISEKSASSDVGALVMEEGVAHLCYITQSTTLLRNKIQKNIQKKKSGNEQREKSLRDFYQVCLLAIEQEEILDKVKCLVIASPGFVKDEFYKYLQQQSQLDQYKNLGKNLNKILLCKSSTGYLNSLIEVMADPTVQNRLQDTKALAESKILDQFFKALRTDPNKVAYGIKDIKYVHQQKAIQILLMSDKLSRTKELQERKIYIKMMDEVQKNGGQVYIFSSLHPTGQQLNNFTGIAAILYFPVILDFEQDQDDDQQSDEQQNQLQQQVEQQSGFVINEDIAKQFDDFDSEQFM